MSRNTAGDTRAEARGILRLAQPRLRVALPGILVGILAAFCTVALLATSAWLITKAAEQPPILFLSMAVVGVRAFALGRAFFRYLERLVSHDAAFRQLEAVRVEVLRRLIPLAPGGLGRAKRGSLLSALVSDVDDLQNLPLRVVQPIVTSLGVAVVAVVGVAFLSPVAALGLAVCLVLAFAVSAFWVTRYAARAERSIAPRRAAVLDALLDYLNNLDVLTAYGADTEARARIERADADLTQAVVRRAGGAGIAAATLSLFSGLAVVIAVIAGIPAFGAGTLSAPELAVIALVPLAVFEIVAMVPVAVGVFRQVRSSAARIAEVVPATVPAGIPVDDPAARVGGDRGGVDVGSTADRRGEDVASSVPRIQLTDLSVRWPGRADAAVRGVTVTLEPGDRLLVEGESGAGKTSLAQALVRFVDVYGDYLIDGVPAQRMPQDEVRRIVGLSEQTPYLFDETIRQNLLFAKDDADDAQLLDVLRRVGLDSWVAARGGLDARVGERGSLVSGGQAQRIALARALLHDFPVLVLDEPTANVEADLADALVRDLVAAAGDRRTVILISHTDVPAGLFSRRLTLRPDGDARLSESPRP
ncbi:thiol reductant ABC exporter subunit CydC [Leifsonia sp. ALI-44-B]|uniref:thiol reductant ABC exporter subunit CydC n=1 Tax=Leifsonia sp. ALI-44-B TaxID=1933776 RepID=UPI00097C7FB9|nr:thiol reductant ABC exporter subunit CydC [Leifsonia sp. ALI-44-B]ONI63744.1 thiol reductant ABC exporter subunit CydC [Leifsonia sp. ALI-44-B]